MNASDRALAIIRKYEGLRLEAYLDSVGIPTIGYGHTAGVKLGDTCTEEQAEAWLLSDVLRAENCIRQCVSAALTQCEFDALVSFVFNLGCLKFRSSTLLRKLNAGDYDGAADEFPKWCHAGGVELAGLKDRRNDERQVFEAAA